MTSAALMRGGSIHVGLLAYVVAVAGGGSFSLSLLTERAGVK